MGTRVQRVTGRTATTGDKSPIPAQVPGRRPNTTTRVPITPNGGPTGFAELPVPHDGTRYDPSDCKFLAVAAAHQEHPPILQATDSKWRDWVGALRTSGVRIHFVCPDEIERMHRTRAEL